MFLKSIQVRNYKSLKDVVFEPSHLTCLVGPNAAGKTNLTDALHFLSETYRHGLEVAIARKGGYENVAYRLKRRSKAPISFHLVVEARVDELRHLPRRFAGGKRKTERASTSLNDLSIRYTHAFSFAARGQNIKADYEVVSDTMSVSVRGNDQELWTDVYEVKVVAGEESESRRRIRVEQHDGGFADLFENDLQFLRFYLESADQAQPQLISDIDSQTLAIGTMRIGLTSLRAFTDYVASFQVYRLSPQLSRDPGVPTPNPQLTESGQNLPALVEWLRTRHPERWEVVLDGMRDVMPSLVDIGTQYLHTKTLGLEFEEEGFGRKWTATDVSDGTIQALAILVASADPRATLLMVEEIENSVHGWVIRTAIERLRRLSDEKNVILTTHSPLVVDLMYPSEIWLVYRVSGKTEMRMLTTLGSDLQEQWESGAYKLSELLDSGSLGQAVPGGVL